MPKRYGDSDEVSSYNIQKTPEEIPDETLSFSGVITPPQGSTPGMTLPTLGVDQRYENSEEFARGGLGRVLKAHDKRLDRPVAIKELLSGHQDAEERFLREAKVAAQLEHPAIIPVHDAGRWPNGAPFYTMKLMSGKTLATALQNAKSLIERLALLPHVIDACEAIAYAHSKKIIHRDVKPLNILIGEFGETIVIDWGLAKELVDSSQHTVDREDPKTKEKEPPALSTVDRQLSTDLTQAGAILGTPTYMPPEQARGESVDERADVYSLGAILYHLLAGESPYPSKTAQLTLARVASGPPPKLESKQPGIPKDLIAICEKAMSRDARDRYPSAKELCEDLKKFQTGQLVGAHHYSTGELFRRWVKRHQGSLWVAALSVLLLVVGAVYSLIEINAKRRAAEENEAKALEGQAAAQLAEHRATSTLDALRVEQARGAVEEDPAKALSLLSALSEDFPRYRAVRMIAASAADQSIPAVLTGNTAPVSTLALSPDGTLLAAGGDDSIVRIWDLRCLRQKAPAKCPPKELKGHKSWIWGLVFSSDGASLLSFGIDHSLYSWSVATGESVRCKGHQEFIRTAQFSPDGAYIVSASADKSTRVWDAKTGAMLAWLKEEVFSFVVSPDGKYIAAATVGFDILLWDTKDLPSLPEPRRLVGHHGAPQIAFSPDSKLLASGGGDGEIRFWEVSSAKRLATIREHRAFLDAVAFSPDGKLFASAGDDKTIRLWEVACVLSEESAPTSEDPCMMSRVLLGHEGNIGKLAFSPDGKFLASSSNDHTVRLWDVARASTTRVFPHRDIVYPVLFTKDGSLLASGSFDKNVYLWKVQDDDTILEGDQKELWSVAFSPDGKQIASAGLDQKVRLWDTTTKTAKVFAADLDDTSALGFRPDGRPTTMTLDPSYQLQFIGKDTRFSSDGKLLASAGLDGRVYVWELPSGARHVLKGHEGRVRKMSFSPDGTLLATASRDGTARLWDLKTFSEVKVLANREKIVFDVAFSPDGATVATVGERVRLWDVKSGELLVQYNQDGGEPVVVAFSPDGKRLAYSGYDGVLRMCEVTKDQCESFEGHSMAIFSLSFSPDSERIATASQDETIRVWSTKTKESVVLRGHERGVRAVLFSPTGKTIASISPDRTARLWDVETGESRVLRGHTDLLMALAFSPDGLTLATASVDHTIRLWRDDLPYDTKALRDWISAALSARS